MLRLKACFLTFFLGNFLTMFSVKSDTVRIVQEFAEAHKLNSITVFSNSNRSSNWNKHSLERFYGRQAGQQDSFIHVLRDQLCDER